jgi:hypothetical protein
MSFDWSNYLVLAEHIMNRSDWFPDKEACYRSVVSRAYYGVYCLVRNFAREVDKFEAYGNAHKELQDHLIKHPHKARKRLGNQLRRLHENRLKADYYDNLDEPAINKAQKAITQARNIKNDLDKLTS